MKKLYLILFGLISFVSFSQSENDTKEIIGLLVNKYKVDTINVYYKFQNQELISDLNSTEIKAIDYAKIIEDCSKIADSVVEKDKFSDCFFKSLPHDTATFKFEKIRVNFGNNDNELIKTSDKKIKKIFNATYSKNNKRKPIVFISFPLISSNKKRAVVYCTYITGAVSGNKGFFNLEKIDGKWKIRNYEYKGFM